MKRMIVAAVAAALLGLTSGTAMADSSNKSVFPKYEDPWRNWGKPHVKHHHHIQPPQTIHYHHHYVWVQGYWWWNGAYWVWIPGYWRAL